VRVALAGAVLAGSALVGLATPALANTPTPTPTLTDCQRAFAATGLLGIRNFQASNMSPEAKASFYGTLLNAYVGYQVCLASALG
jgi:hypothetical protein